MKQLQNPLGAIILGLAMIVLLGGCGSPPLIQPASDAPAAQTTAATSQSVSTATAASPESAAPESPLATPLSVPATETPTAVLETPASSSNEIEYAAEKISLAPVNLSVDLPEISASSEEAPDISFGGWSNSGQQFAFVLLFPDGPAELWIANIDGTDLQQIVADHSGGFIVWSPDDSRILYYKFKGAGPSKDELWTIQLDTNTSMNLDEPLGVSIDETDVYGNVAWVDEHHLLYPTYPKSETGSRHLWLHNVQTGQIEEVDVSETFGEQWRSLNLGPDKTAIVGRISDSLWLGNFVKDNGQPRLDYVKTLISDDKVVTFWAPDSSKLALVSADLSRMLRVVDLTADEIVEITLPHTVARVEWSPDSQAMIVSIFGAGTGLPGSMYVVNSDGSGLRELGAFFYSTMRWSPGGQYLGLFASDETAGFNPFGIIKVEVNP